MRLGQLARKLERTPAEILEFLASKNIVIEEGVNSKLEESHITLVLQQYAPALRADIIEQEDDLTAGLPAAAGSQPESIQEEEGLEPARNADISEPEQSDIIRVPKVELAGLKVLGKIDLPEPKKKQPETAEEATESDPPKEFKKEKRPQHYKITKGPAKNPIAIQREQEALAAKRKHEEELRQQKERRTQNYLKRVKAHQPTKAAKLIKEEAEQMSPAELQERPKTWWGKLVRWFTS